MNNVTNTMNNTISISSFSAINVDKIFEDVKMTGVKVVMKDDVAECVLISPSEYEKLIEEVNDVRLVSLATKRLENYDHNNIIDGEDVFQKLGITDDDLENYDEVEFE